MQFATVTVGDRDFAYSLETALIVPFAFPSPVNRVHCALQAFEVSYPDDDEHLELVRIEPRVEFDSLASPTSGQVRVHLAFRDEGEETWDAHVATFYARLLMIGE